MPERMNTKKAYIKLDGNIGEKEQPAIEYVDTGHTDRLNKMRQDLRKLLTLPKDDTVKKQ